MKFSWVDNLRNVIKFTTLTFILKLLTFRLSNVRELETIKYAFVFSLNFQILFCQIRRTDHKNGTPSLLNLYGKTEIFFILSMRCMISIALILW